VTAQVRKRSSPEVEDDRRLAVVDQVRAARSVGTWNRRTGARDGKPRGSN
jgi:hypothetical protein